MSEQCKDGEHVWTDNKWNSTQYCENCRIIKHTYNAERYKQALEDIRQEIKEMGKIPTLALMEINKIVGTALKDKEN